MLLLVQLVMTFNLYLWQELPLQRPAIAYRSGETKRLRVGGKLGGLYSRMPSDPSVNHVYP